MLSQHINPGSRMATSTRWGLVSRAAGHKCWSQQRLRKMEGFYGFIVIPKEIERITVYPCRNSDNSLFYLLWHYPHMFIRISIREDRMLCGFCIFMQTKTHALHSRPDISFVGFIQTPPNKHRSPRRKMTVGNSQTGLMEFPHRFQSKQISKLHDLGNLENCPGDPDQLFFNIEQYQQYLTASF